MPKPITFDEFVRHARTVHGDRYDYAQARDRWCANRKIPIGCPDHGVFDQLPYNHCSGQGCPVCSRARARHTIRHSPEKIAALLCARGHPYELRVDTYTTRGHLATWYCRIHEIEFQGFLDRLLRLGAYGCPLCREEAQSAQRVAARHDPRADANLERIAAVCGPDYADIYRRWLAGDLVVEMARHRSESHQTLEGRIAKLQRLTRCWNAAVRWPRSPTAGSVRPLARDASRRHAHPKNREGPGGEVAKAVLAMSPVIARA